MCGNMPIIYSTGTEDRIMCKGGISCSTGKRRRDVMNRSSADWKEEMKMENRPIIKKEQVETVYDSRFIKVFDLQYEPGKHYFDATRRSIENLAAVKNDEEFKQMLPDAVSCVVILNVKDQEPRLCLSREYRYPAGQFLLSVPAGLLVLNTRGFTRRMLSLSSSVMPGSSCNSRMAA